MSDIADEMVASAIEKIQQLPLAERADALAALHHELSNRLDDTSRLPLGE